MAENESAAEWGAKILQRFEDLATDLSRPIQATQTQVNQLSESIAEIKAEQKSLSSLYATLITDRDQRDANDAKTIAHIDNAVGASARSTHRELVGTFFLLFITFVVGISYVSISIHNNIDNTSTSLIAEQRHNAEEIDKVTSEVKRAQIQMPAEQLKRIETALNDLEKSKGESYSEFMTQRSRLTQENLKEKTPERLLFEVALTFESLSPAKSARPSAVLAMPHDQRLDKTEFQLKVKRINDSRLQVTLASKPDIIDAIAAFLSQENGAIPLDLTVRTPVDKQ